LALKKAAQNGRGVKRAAQRGDDFPFCLVARVRALCAIRLKPWVSLILLATATVAVVFSVDFYRHRFVRSDAQMFDYLPQSGASLFYANLATLRRSGMLKLLAGEQPEEADYRDFVRQTQFDYSRDINAMAGAVSDQQTSIIARGRFDWGKLLQYARANGGSCEGELCSVPSTKPGRWTSFLPIQSDVIGLAISSEGSAARNFSRSGYSAQEEISKSPVWGSPVWIKVSPDVLRDPANLPLAMRIFAVSLQPANPVYLSVRPIAPGGRQVAFDLQLNALCPSEPTADTVRNQLEIQTKMLRLELAREHERPNPSDLTGLLTAGTFQVTGKRVIGIWPVRPELLNSLR
jgi:hypothetical protein